MKDIHDNGGIRLTLDFGSGRSYYILVIPVIQFIIITISDSENF